MQSGNPLAIMDDSVDESAVTRASLRTKFTPPTMKFRSVLAATLVLVIAACGVVPLPLGLTDPTAPPPLAAQDAPFRTLVARWFGVWSKDPASISDAEALFAPNADALFFDGFMPIEGRFGADGWSAAARHKATELYSRFEVTPREGVWLTRLGDRAIASVPFRVTLRSKTDRTGETDGRATLLWERREGGWRIVHEHTSFALLEEWLGGEEPAVTEETDDHLGARDAEFQRLVDTYLAALAVSRSSDAEKADAPSRFYSPANDVVVWNPTSRRPLIGWSAVAAHRDAIDLRIYLTRKQSRGDVRVWKSGDLAWATFTFTARATRRDGDRFEMIGRQTDVFQRIDGEWRIVHEHASIPYGPDGTPGIRSELAQTTEPLRTTRSIPQLPAVPVGTVARVEPTTQAVSFEKLVAEYCSVWSTKDGTFDDKAIARVYSPEGLKSSRTYYGAEPWTVALKESLWTEGMTSLALTPGKDLTVVRRGNTAWTTCTFTLEYVQRQGGGGKGRQFQTAIWEFRGDRWVIAHEHVTLAL